jgi:type IV secretion system protein VirB11
VHREVHAGAPIVSAELPETGERFEGLIPPVAIAPCFSVRKPADVLYRLRDYVAARIMSPLQADALAMAVRERRNILVVGGTSSGKTTLVNALLAEVADCDERVLILEDTRELKCAAKDCVALRTKPGVASLADLVRSTLRLRPDRIIVGEVRGPEALDMLKAWNTGHPGGIATVHANSAVSALYRLEQLVQESVVTVPRRLIADAIDMIVFIAGRGLARRVDTIARVAGLDPDGGYAVLDLTPDHALEPQGE